MNHPLITQRFPFLSQEEIETILMLAAQEQAERPSDQATMDVILQVVSSVTGVCIPDIVGDCRRRPIVEARKMFAILCRENTYASWQAIGERINRDHSSAIYLRAKAAHHSKYEHEFGEMLKICREKVRQLTRRADHG